MKSFLIYMVIFVLGAFFATGLICLFIDAACRESAALNEMRRTRCVKYGENIPVELVAYCQDLGV